MNWFAHALTQFDLYFSSHLTAFAIFTLCALALYTFIGCVRQDRLWSNGAKQRKHDLDPYLGSAITLWMIVGVFAFIAVVGARDELVSPESWTVTLIALSGGFVGFIVAAWYSGWDNAHERAMAEYEEGVTAAYRAGMQAR